MDAAVPCTTKVGRTQSTEPHRAIQKKGLIYVTKLIMKGGSVNVRNRNKETPLHIATRYNLKEVASLLIEFGASVFTRDRRREKPLHIAAKCGHKEMLNMLLKHDWNVRAKNREKRTPLDLAKRYGHSTIQMILERSGYLTIQKKLFLQAFMHVAAAKGFIELLDTMIKDGLDINAMDDDEGNTPLHYAAFSGKDVKRIDFSNTTWYESIWVKNMDGSSDQNYREIVEMLVANGAKVNACNFRHLTPLHFAAASGCREMVKLLLDRGADPNACGGDSSHHHSRTSTNDNEMEYFGERPVHCAAASGEIDVIKLLLEHGADIYAKNFRLETILHRAAGNGHVEVVECFLEKFSFATTNVKKRNRDEASIYTETEMFTASVNIEKEKTNFLDVESTFNLMTHSDSGTKAETSIISTTQNHPKNIASLLLEKNIIQKLTTKQNQTALQYVASGICNQRDVENLETLVNSGEFNVNVLDLESFTPLHTIVSCCHCKNGMHKAFADYGMQVLLDNEADVNIQNFFGITPLMKASEAGCFHIVCVLLDSDDNRCSRVEVDMQDMHGETALMKASREQHLEVVKLLVDKGASIVVRDNRGFTALHCTVYKGSCTLFNNKQTKERRETDILKLLLETCPDASNIADYYDNTVLDLWMKYASDISPKTINGFIQRGCTFRSLSGIKIPIYMREQLNHDFMMFEMKNRELIHQFHIFHSTQADQYRSSISELSLEMLSPINYMLSFLIMTPLLIYMNLGDILRKIRHEADMKRTALHYEVIKRDLSLGLYGVRDKLLMDLVTSGCDVNALDADGRTPLHYATSKDTYNLLLENGANENLKDKYGYTAMDIQERLLDRWGKIKTEIYHPVFDLTRNFLEKIGKKRGKLNINSVYVNKRRREPSHSEAWRIWQENVFAFRQPASRLLTDEVTKFVYNLAECMKSQDSRFEFKPILVGSAFEETKIIRPDEWDFNLMLTKLSKVCKVVESPDAPKGLVHLKKETDTNRSVEFGRDEYFDDFFNRDGYLLCDDVLSRFSALLYQSLAFSHHHLFEWNMMTDYNYSLRSRGYREKKCISIHLKMIKPLEELILENITIDIVPCVHVNGFWPKSARDDIGEQLKEVGCNIVFHQPEWLAPWVVLPNPYARVSFARLESTVIKNCPVALKAAYMVAKHLIDIKDNYVLKTALLHCNEALQGKFTWSSELLRYEDITEEDLEIAVRKLMWCYLEFHRQGFYPDYCMPFPTTIKNYRDMSMKLESLQYSDNYDFYLGPILSTIITYLTLFRDETEVEFRVPIPSNNEQFDRKSFLEKLSHR